MTELEERMARREVVSVQEALDYLDDPALATHAGQLAAVKIVRDTLAALKQTREQQEAVAMWLTNWFRDCTEGDTVQFNGVSIYVGELKGDSQLLYVRRP